tara:strand:+ start:11347 stop:12375 length:1029 start_codon:yes stop_codon:yes gene_type:complete
MTFLDYFERFYDGTFFPYLKKHSISTVIDLGDTFDRRKYINFHTLKRAKEMWFDRLKENDIQVHALVGNHCVYYKNTNEVNSLKLLLPEYDNIKCYSHEPVEIDFGLTKILLVPWITNNNFNICMDAMEDTDAQIMFGHFEIQGFEMHTGIINQNGLPADAFDKFDVVCSGHFHHKSTIGTITYLGAPYEITWSDYNDARGFHVFDTETRKLEYVRNPNKMFHKVFYTEDKITLENIHELDLSYVKDCYIKVIIQNKENPYLFDMFIERLEEAGPASFVVVDDHMNLDLGDDEDLIDQAEDTLTILSKYINSLELDGIDTNSLQTLLHSLYNEASSLDITDG